MATNQFLPFGIGAGANVLSPAAYAALAARTGGFTAGTAKSQELNSVWRQAAFGVSALAQFIADQSGDDVLDDGNIANFKASLIKAINLLNLNAGYGVDTGSANVYQVAFTPAVTALVDGLRLRFRAKTANTGASTFSPNGVSAAPIWSKKHGALTGGEIIANGEVEVVWNAALNTTGAWVLLENTGGADQLPAGSYGTTPGFGDSSLAVPTTDFVQQAMGAILAKNVAGGANVTLTAVEARYPIIALTGALTANINVIVPASSREWIIYNNTSGGFTLTVKTASGTGVAVTQGTAINLFCDGTNVLQAGITVPAQSVQGVCRNLTASAAGTNATVLVGADEIALESTANQYLTVRNVSLSINTAATGANGLDTGSLTGSTWYSLWIISNGSTTAGLISLSATSPTMPSGYTYRALVGYIRTDNTANKYPLAFTQAGQWVWPRVTAGTNVASLPVIANGTAGNALTPSWVAIGLTGFVPPNAVEVSIVARVPSASRLIVAPNTAYGSVQSATNPPHVILNSASGTGDTGVKANIQLESTSIYWAADNPGGQIVISGWRMNI
ncbi:hypothetical protein [Metapseudomonas otitidis]|uniref:hypothetical protein n=1 Tax=Metapseudomonas otitidis TaxID=319939 RepID=UPI00244C5907|nr:hypothetical protein [Pseudomonas otitidis]MDG9784626.1 hypothetical protein [Pseudomonas otitidis]